MGSDDPMIIRTIAANLVKANDAVLDRIHLEIRQEVSATGAPLICPECGWEPPERTNNGYGSPVAYPSKSVALHRRQQHGLVGKQRKNYQRDIVAVFKELQENKCYLCERELDSTAEGDNWKVHLDHHHGHCPGGRGSGGHNGCNVCRRGLSHHVCNKLIGLADENSDVLYRIADNLAKAKFFVEQRLTAIP